MLMKSSQIRTMKQEYDSYLQTYPTGIHRLDCQLEIVLDLIQECLEFAYTDATGMDYRDFAYMAAVFADVLQETHEQTQLLKSLFARDEDA